MTTRRRKRRKSRKTKKSGSGWKGLRIALVLLIVAALLGYIFWLDYKVRARFEGTRWALPAHVYARPLELYAGAALTGAELERELERLDYRFVRQVRRPGEVSRKGNVFDIYTRSFQFWDAPETATDLRIRIDNGRVQSLIGRDTAQPIDLIRLDPAQIASIYPSHREDRILVRLDEISPTLIDTLLVVEDREFYAHSGISTRSVVRALVANLKAGSVVQGGSTLTQQLVKNFYLSNERTLRRKLNEAVMALLLEMHYSKQEILEAYLNEVYLGQDGPRAIHGFGLASRFYFDRDLADLSVDQIALLVGLVKGPSYYDPRRNTHRAAARRDLVLDLMEQQGYLAGNDVLELKSKPLGIVRRKSTPVNAFPAFMDLVRRQLQRDYREEDLNSQGLSIFTTLDPALQAQAMDALKRRVERLEQQRGMKADSLQGAFLITNTANAEVLALAGGRDNRFTGFNRALDARRPIGSLVKPAVFLRALEDTSRYTLATMVEDTPLSVQLDGGKTWEPRNYDQEFRQQVMVYDALVHSYNVPTARVGLDVGVGSVIRTLRRLGVPRDFRPYPSLLLGAVEMSPAEVTQMYQTLAAGGFRSPLRAIDAVVAADGTPLQRYPLRIEQVVASGPVYLVNFALQGVVREGTAAGLGMTFPPDLGIAGKTGTTNDLRDSWFAGFGGNLLGVVWLGQDDNQPMGLTGSTGALQVWRDIMVKAHLQPLILTPAPHTDLAEIDMHEGLLADRYCADRRELPFISGTVPDRYAACARTRGNTEDSFEWLKNIFR